MGSDDIKKKGLTYEAGNTDYPEEGDTLFPPEEEAGDMLLPPEEAGERAPSLWFRKAAEEEAPRPPEKPKKGIRLENEIRLGEFYVPAGTYSLGKGGQAQIYDCFREGKESGCVAKRYNSPRNGPEERILAQISKINRTIMQLNHPNLPKLYMEERMEDGSYVVIMKKYQPYSGFLEHARFEGSPKAYEQMFINEVEGLNSALKLLHSHKIYHADIKPANIMQDVDAKGGRHLVLIDFGIGVQGLETNMAVTVHGKTDTYMPPELYLMTKRKVNEYTDYYSFGMTMAEFVAGRYPVRNNMLNRPQDQAYLNTNRASVNQFYGLLLPAALPDYLARFFEGTIYVKSELLMEELHKRRWGSARVDEWLYAVRNTDYEKARGIPTGLSIEESASGTSIRVIYGSDEPAIVIHSTDEMAVMFLNHWDETIEKLLRQARWSRIFSNLGEDVSVLIEQTREDMQANMGKREEIFDRMIMENYLPKQYKENALRFRDLYYFNGIEFGKSIYKMMAEEKIYTKGSYRLPNKIQEEKQNLFQRMMRMFSSGKVESFLEEHQNTWQVGDEEIRLAKQIRENLSQNNKERLVENLYRLSFILQGEPCLAVSGMNMTYRNYKQFLDDFREICEKNEEKAATLLNELFTKDKRLRMDYYLFLQEASDVVTRPGVSTMEKLA